MHEIEYKIASEKDIDLMMSSRLEMLRVVNGLDADYQFSEDFIHNSRVFFQKGDQTTVLALAEKNVIGCATICYIWLMPTFSHPTGKQAHLMNVYTSEPYRRQGIAKHMVSMLMEDAWNHGATEISLDSTPSGHPFYESLGFVDSNKGMHGAYKILKLAWSGQAAIQTITSASLSSRLTSFACLMSHVSRPNHMMATPLPSCRNENKKMNNSSTRRID